MSKRHQNRIVEPICEHISTLAEETGTDPGTLCKLLMGKLKIQTENRTDMLPTITAAAIICDSKLGREAYTRQRKMFLANNNKSLPTWKEVMDLRNSITPT